MSGLRRDLRRLLKVLPSLRDFALASLCVIARRNDEAIQVTRILDCFVPRSDAKRVKYLCKNRN